MVDDLLTIFSVGKTINFGITEVILAIVLPFILCLPIAYSYKKFRMGEVFNLSFFYSLFIFSSLVAIITLIIGNNIARAFGLVGALSIIRFRTTIKSVIDSMHLFWALAVGMACGVGYYLVAILIVILCGLSLFLLKFFKLGIDEISEGVLKIHFDRKINSSVQEFEKLLSDTTTKYKISNIFHNSEEYIDTYIYNVEIKKNQNIDLLYEQINSIKGIKSFNHIHNEAFSLFE